MWKRYKLSELGILKTGTTPKTSEKENFGNDIPFIKPADFGSDGTINYENDGLSEAGAQKSRITKANSVLMVCIGATIGKVGFTDRDVTTNQQINSIELSPEINTKFLYYIMKTSKFQRLVIKSSSQATLPIINKKKWGELELQIPPLIEQQRIVAKLDAAFAEIDTAIDSANAQINNIDMLRQRILNGWIEKNASSEDYCTVQDCIDKEWIKQPFDGNHGEIHPKASDYTATGVPFIMAKDLSNGEVNLTECKFISHEQAASLRVGFAKNNDVLFTHKGTIGEVALLECQLDFVMLTPQVTAYRVIDESRIDRLFLYYLFKSVFFQSQIKQIAGIGTTRAYIGITRQKQLSLCLPSIELQQQAVSMLNNSEPYVSAIGVANKNKLEQLSKLKSSILAQELQSEAA